LKATGFFGGRQGGGLEGRFPLFLSPLFFFSPKPSGTGRLFIFFPPFGFPFHLSSFGDPPAIRPYVRGGTEKNFPPPPSFLPPLVYKDRRDLNGIPSRELPHDFSLLPYGGGGGDVGRWFPRGGEKGENTSSPPPFFFFFFSPFYAPHPVSSHAITYPPRGDVKNLLFRSLFPPLFFPSFSTTGNGKLTGALFSLPFGEALSCSLSGPPPAQTRIFLLMEATAAGSFSPIQEDGGERGVLPLAGVFRNFFSPGEKKKPARAFPGRTRAKTRFFPPFFLPLLVGEPQAPAPPLFTRFFFCCERRGTVV